MQKDFDMFANRLAKMVKHISKWAKKNNVTCYRIYDHDVPQFPFAIDRYEDVLYLTEYQTSYPMTEDEHMSWLGMCLTKLVEVTEIPLDNIFYKTRRRQKGLSQYTKESDEGYGEIVNENGLKFKINLTDYLDTGLFLDHRNTRQMVREEAKDKSVLNLFSYTGAFSVYAAAGEAAKVTTIDMSFTYMSWAKENFKINGFVDPKKYQFIQADVIEWLAQSAGREKYDIIVLDPPTFSNSKRMLDVLDIQRDHATLINQCLRILNPGGSLYFSTNFRRFQMDSVHIATHNIKNTSAQTVPNDYRDKKIHFSFKIKKEN
jgi:23S rRNA (cytosine1962-C5)-methyltransferase